MGCPIDARRLRQLRQERGLTQEELGQYAGRSASWVQHLEGAYRANLTPEDVARLASALGVAPAELEPGSNGYWVWTGEGQDPSRSRTGWEPEGPAAKRIIAAITAFNQLHAEPATALALHPKTATAIGGAVPGYHLEVTSSLAPSQVGVSNELPAIPMLALSCPASIASYLLGAWSEAQHLMPGMIWPLRFALAQSHGETVTIQTPSKTVAAMFGEIIRRHSRGISPISSHEWSFPEDGAHSTLTVVRLF